MVEVKLDNDSMYNLSAEYLRISSPAVDSTIRSVGGGKVIYGRRHTGIASSEPIGIMELGNCSMTCIRLAFSCGATSTSHERLHQKSKET